MPNVAELEKESLFFENYYNHTFPTYRGLIGQLFSGYQLQNYDENTLVSVQEAFRKNGYHTSVINTEPLNLNFATYLESLGFDEVVTNVDIEPEGTSSTLSDRQAYESLYDVISGEHAAGHPFMTAIYTFGTHVSLDSPDEKFGDGSDRLLNKFYSCDFQFGRFMYKFLESDMADDTIIIFTADLCTYADSDFTGAFPGFRRAHTECDSMPLLIYYRGIEPETVDVNGRNSLDFAPTLLDYLDIRIGNYFLGFTLFADDQTSANMTSFDRIFSDSAVHASTEDASINGLSDVQKEIFESELHKYYAAKTQQRAK
jgi:phosphoglycerol transferase MdoB-like AlkP superfamily enzyme